MTETEYLAHVCAYLSAPGPADNHARKKKGKIINKLSELLVLRKHEKGRAKAYVCCRCSAADAAPVATQQPTSVERKKEGENQIVSCCSIPPLLSSLLSSLFHHDLVVSATTTVWMLHIIYCLRRRDSIPLKNYFQNTHSLNESCWFLWTSFSSPALS